MRRRILHWRVSWGSTLWEWSTKHLSPMGRILKKRHTIWWARSIPPDFIGRQGLTITTTEHSTQLRTTMAKPRTVVGPCHVCIWEQRFLGIVVQPLRAEVDRNGYYFKRCEFYRCVRLAPHSMMMWLQIYETQASWYSTLSSRGLFYILATCYIWCHFIIIAQTFGLPFDSSQTLIVKARTSSCNHLWFNYLTDNKP